MVQLATCRAAVSSDAEAIQAIYAPFCAADCPISFEIEPPSIEEMSQRIAKISLTLPWIVVQSAEGEVLGYAYASHHKERAAYRWSVDVSVYLAPQARGQGLGTTLYDKLFELLKILGYVNAYAGVTLPNQASEALHKSVGFEPVGVYEKVGYKAGKWHDVAWFYREIQAHEDLPAEPASFADYLKKQKRIGPDQVVQL
jgi:phosphinothricin acetyltransferase